VDDISVPVLCISSLDDPVCTKDTIPFDLFKYYPHMLLATLDKGGHGGFLEGSKPKSWAEDTAVDYVVSVLEFIAMGGSRR
jgi:abhydrolase domain-containing protein 15